MPTKRQLKDCVTEKYASDRMPNMVGEDLYETTLAPVVRRTAEACTYAWLHGDEDYRELYLGILRDQEAFRKNLELESRRRREFREN